MTYFDRFSAKRRTVFPVIHVQDFEQVTRNLLLAIEAGADGVFLISHDTDGRDNELEPVIEILTELRGETRFDHTWIGANLLGSTNQKAHGLAHQLNLNGIWSDDARSLSLQAQHDFAMKGVLATSAQRQGRNVALYFGGAYFKYQYHIGDGTEEAAAATRCCDVVTTSGPSTGQEAPIDQIVRMRQAIGDFPLALASGITLENVGAFLPYVNAFLVATSVCIKGDFYNFDPGKLPRLVDTIHAYQPPQ